MGLYVEYRFRVDEFLAFYPGRGLSGAGLVSFIGLRAARTYRPEDKAGPWEVDPKPLKHVIDYHGVTVM